MQWYRMSVTYPADELVPESKGDKSTVPISVSQLHGFVLLLGQVIADIPDEYKQSVMRFKTTLGGSIIFIQFI